jgi:hypothetical protein
MGIAYNSKTNTDGLLFCVDAGSIKSYPGSGTIWYDVGGRSNDGTLINGPVYSSVGGGSILFDGTNDVIQLKPFSNLLASDITVETWVNITSLPSDWVRIVGVGGNGTNRTFGLWYSVEGRILWQRYGAGDPALIPSSPIISLNTWSHICATTSGSSHKLYLNGTEIGSSSGTGPWPISSENVTIGFAGFHARLTGYVSNVKLYNIGFNSSQIKENFDIQKKRFGL